MLTRCIKCSQTSEHWKSTYVNYIKRMNRDILTNEYNNVFYHLEDAKRKKNIEAMEIWKFKHDTITDWQIVTYSSTSI